MTEVTNAKTAAELNETQLDQVVGAGGLIIDRRGNAVAADSDVVVHEADVIVHDRKGA